MPCRPSPKTLKQNSLDAVANHLELLCYGAARGSKILATLIETDQIKDFDSPFQDWPGGLLEDLSTTIYSRRAGLKHLLLPVIQPQMRHYSILIHGSIHVAMDLVSKRCQNLQSLSFTYSINLPPVYYAEFFRHFHHLTKINLFGSMVDDIAFGSIGEHCPNLIELNAGKTWITNTGVGQLSLGSESNHPLCPKLKSLDVTETRVTADGLGTFLITHPDILRLEHEESLALLGKHWSQNAPSNILRLNATRDRIQPETFERAIQHCPRVESLTITSFGLSDENLYRLMGLKYLTSLHLANSMGQSFTFQEGVVPVLQGCGHNLQKLILEKFTEADVGLIGSLCPNLAHLSLASILSYPPVLTHHPGHFQKLQNLELWSHPDRHICPTVIKQCMMNGNLERLLLQCVSSLTDPTILEIISHNPMLSLENLVFDRCHGISAQVLWKFLELPNQLAILRCWNCSQVGVTDKAEIKAAIKESNLTLYWEWYPYTEDEDYIQHEAREYDV